MKCCFFLLFVAAIAQAGELQNPGFEQPTLTGWVTFSSTGKSDNITLDKSTPFQGKQALRLTTTGTVKAYQGVFQSLPVEAGQKYTWAVHVRVRAAGHGRGQISIEWKNADGTERERTWGPDWSTNEPGAWQEFTMSATAPAGATRAHFVVTAFDGEKAGDTGSFAIDEASVTTN